MKIINIIVLDESIFALNNKDLTLFEDTIKIDYSEFEDWFYKKYLKDKNIYCKNFIREYIHPNHIEKYTKLFFNTIKKETKKEIYIITMNPDILQYFSSFSKKDDKIEIKYYLALKEPTQNKYVLKDEKDLNEVYRVLVDKTNNDFFREQEESVFGEPIKEILLKIIKENYKADNFDIIGYVMGEENIMYVHFTMWNNEEDEEEIEKEYLENLEGDKDNLILHHKHDYNLDELDDEYIIVDIKEKRILGGTQDQQSYLEKLKNDADI